MIYFKLATFSDIDLDSEVWSGPGDVYCLPFYLILPWIYVVVGSRSSFWMMSSNGLRVTFI